MTTLEELVKLLQDNPNPLELNRHFDVFVGGVVDLASRLSYQEHTSLKHQNRIDALETKVVDLTTQVTSIASDRRTLMARQDAVEKLPAGHDEAIGALEGRVRALEGAVGSIGASAAA